MIRNFYFRSGVVAVMAVLFVSTMAYGWAKAPPTSGTVGFMQIAGDGLSFSFYLVNNPAICNSVAVGGSTSAGLVKVGYAGVTEQGLRNLLSTMTAAKLSGKSVSIYANDGGAFGACQVGAIDFN